jgi:hypothetical protein
MRKPWSVFRLVSLSQTWSFESDAAELADEPDGEPRVVKAIRRVGTALREHQDAQGVDYGCTWRDERTMAFHISDVAILLDEYRRLCVLEDKVIRAMGPPTMDEAGVGEDTAG